MWAAFIYLGVSLVSLAVQVFGLGRMADTNPRTPALVRRAMARTAACRVIAALLYVVLGGLAVSGQQQAAAPTALVVFTVIQVMWQANAIADVILRRALDGGRHRQSRG